MFFGVSPHNAGITQTDGVGEGDGHGQLDKGNVVAGTHVSNSEASIGYGKVKRYYPLKVW